MDMITNNNNNTMNMTTNNKDKAMDMALELVKQIITLASGILVLSATFLPNIKSLTSIPLGILLLSWITLIISIVLGIQTISAFVQNKLDNSDEWAEGSGKKYAKWCRNLFIIGISIFVFFAIFTSFNNEQNVDDKKQEINNIYQISK
jgi:hypothetical protein